MTSLSSSRRGVSFGRSSGEHGASERTQSVERLDFEEPISTKYLIPVSITFNVMQQYATDVKNILFWLRLAYFAVPMSAKMLKPICYFAKECKTPNY